MEELVNKTYVYCERRGIVTQEEKDWFCYGLSKRLNSLIVGIPAFLIAVLLSNFQTAISFMFSFFWIRSRTNGFHARTELQCVAISLFSEIVFLSIVRQLLNIYIVLLICISSIVCIFSLAPYNHPKMNFTDAEIKGCKTSARKRILVLVSVILASYAYGFVNVSNGLSIGCAMAEVFLCLAYICDWRKKNGKKK